MLINVTINHINQDTAIHGQHPLVEFTAEVGTPELTLKGTFHEWINPSPNGDAPTAERVDANLMVHGDGFTHFIKACEQQLTESWVHAQGTDFGDAIVNELDRNLHHPRCDERTSSGFGRCNCCDLPGGHVLTTVLDEVSNRLNRQNQQATS